MTFFFPLDIYARHGCIILSMIYHIYSACVTHMIFSRYDGVLTKIFFEYEFLHIHTIISARQRMSASASI